MRTCIATRVLSEFKNVVGRLKNYRIQRVDMQRILRGGPKGVRGHHTEVSRLDDLLLGFVHYSVAC